QSMNDVVICLFAAAGFDRAAQGLAGAGRRLADELGVPLRAIVIGSDADALATEIARIADAVTIADQTELAEYQPETCLRALAHLSVELQPRAVLLTNDTYSQELAPRLAHRLGGSAVGDGVEVRVTVAGGRGLGGPEPFATELQPLAELLGAQLAASRAACDAGWVPPTWQVGQTGKKVAPDLYLAIAITGASQHMAGISEAKT